MYNDIVFSSNPIVVTVLPAFIRSINDRYDRGRVEFSLMSPTYLRFFEFDFILFAFIRYEVLYDFCRNSKSLEK